MSEYDPRDWHWIVGGDASRAWSSRLFQYVTSWPAARTTRIASEAELRDVLRVYGIKGPGVDSLDINAERDRRLKTFTYNNKQFDFCDGRGSDINIAGAGTLALAAIISGKQAGDLRWADADRDFTWVAADNATVTMDAHTVLNFAQTAAAWKSRHIRAARALKDANPIPADYTSDARWI